jgi:hypothetical protein
MTPRQAIREYCKWCMGNSSSEVKLCQSASCPLHEQRMGKRPESQALTPCRAIRARCLDCTESAKEVRYCSQDSCLLHTFRFGTNPNRTKNQGATEEDLDQLTSPALNSPIYNTGIEQ